jgi:hypothetical protein
VEIGSDENCFLRRISAVCAVHLRKSDAIQQLKVMILAWSGRFSRKLRPPGGVLTGAGDQKR